ncbi:unnamed protein product [Gadus morhua 'NCC']
MAVLLLLIVHPTDYPLLLHAPCPPARRKLSTGTSGLSQEVELMVVGLGRGSLTPYPYGTTVSGLVNNVGKALSWKCEHHTVRGGGSVVPSAGATTQPDPATRSAACLDPALFSCTFSPPSPHLLPTFSPPSPHLLPTFSPPSPTFLPHLLPHLLLTFSPLSSPHLLPTFSPPSPHLLLTFSHLLLTFSPPSPHLLPTFSPPSPHSISLPVCSSRAQRNFHWEFRSMTSQCRGTPPHAGVSTVTERAHGNIILHLILPCQSGGREAWLLLLLEEEEGRRKRKRCRGETRGRTRRRSCPALNSSVSVRGRLDWRAWQTWRELTPCWASRQVEEEVEWAREACQLHSGYHFFSYHAGLQLDSISIVPPCYTWPLIDSHLS